MPVCSTVRTSGWTPSGGRASLQLFMLAMQTKNQLLCCSFHYLYNGKTISAAVYFALCNTLYILYCTRRASQGQIYIAFRHQFIYILVT